MVRSSALAAPTRRRSGRPHQAGAEGASDTPRRPRIAALASSRAIAAGLLALTLAGDVACVGGPQRAAGSPHPPERRLALIALGLAAVIYGFVEMHKGQAEKEAESENYVPLPTDGDMRVIGGLAFVVGGVTAAVLGAVLMQEDAREASCRSSRARSSTPGRCADGARVATVPTGPPGTVLPIDPLALGPVAPLPAIPADDKTIELARLARRASRDGVCDLAWRLVDRVRRRDPRYGIALMQSPALERCR